MQKWRDLSNLLLERVRCVGILACVWLFGLCVASPAEAQGPPIAAVRRIEWIAETVAGLALDLLIGDVPGFLNGPDQEAIEQRLSLLEKQVLEYSNREKNYDAFTGARFVEIDLRVTRVARMVSGIGEDSVYLLEAVTKNSRETESLVWRLNREIGPAISSLQLQLEGLGSLADKIEEQRIRSEELDRKLSEIDGVVAGEVSRLDRAWEEIYKIYSLIWSSVTVDTVVFWRTAEVVSEQSELVSRRLRELALQQMRLMSSGSGREAEVIFGKKLDYPKGVWRKVEGRAIQIRGSELQATYRIFSASDYVLPRIVQFRRRKNGPWVTESVCYTYADCLEPTTLDWRPTVEPSFEEEEEEFSLQTGGQVDWCPDCEYLARQLARQTRLAEMIVHQLDGITVRWIDGDLALKLPVPQLVISSRLSFGMRNQLKNREMKFLVRLKKGRPVEIERVDQLWIPQAVVRACIRRIKRTDWSDIPLAAESTVIIRWL